MSNLSLMKCKESERQRSYVAVGTPDDQKISITNIMPFSQIQDYSRERLNEYTTSGTKWLKTTWHRIVGWDAWKHIALLFIAGVITTLKSLAPVNNDTFKQECGVCHFANQPGLLPSGSWEKILSNLTSHFGEEVSLDDKSKNVISDYLRANAAEKSSAKRAKKIIKSLRGQTLLRITEIPYIQEKHHALDSDIFSRESIGSWSNCIACHPTAEQGNYDDDFVKIPK